MCVLETSSTSANVVVRMMSSPFAWMTLMVTEPWRALNAAWSLSCLNSYARLQTSVSSSRVVAAWRTNGSIHDTVMYCQGVKESSGLRRSTVGVVKGWLIPSLGRDGSLRGIFSMIRMLARAATGGKAICALARERCVSRSMTTFAKSKVTDSTMSVKGAFLGHSANRTAIDIPWTT